MRPRMNLDKFLAAKRRKGHKTNFNAEARRCGVSQRIYSGLIKTVATVGSRASARFDVILPGDIEAA